MKNCPLTGSHTQTWLIGSRKGTFSDSPRQAGSPHESEPPARLWSVSGVFLECFWGVSGGSVAVGSSPLSACQSGRDKLLCACSHQGLVVLICVKKKKPTKANKETNPAGESAPLRSVWGCEEPPAGSQRLSESGSLARLFKVQSSTAVSAV